MSGAPLSGVRVIDLSTTFMGPYSSSLLAQWGADVIKVESPSGDVVRYIQDAHGTGMGPIFVNANRGKRSVVLDLKTPLGSEAIRRLAQDADVVIHNIRADAARRLGLDAETLMILNPGLVHCTFRGFGAGGPYEDRPAYDDVIQAASGMAAVQGGPGGSPEYVRMSIADKIMGILGAASILAALHGRGETGTGRAIEVPMFESMVAFTLLEQQAGWVFDPPVGTPGYERTESPSRRPCRTADGYLAVMIYTDQQWAAFFDAIGTPELAKDPRYVTIRERTKNTDELYALVNRNFEKRTTAEWEEILDKADIASAPVNTIEDLFEDPHLIATGFFESAVHPTEGAMRLARPPIRMGADQVELRPAPRLGEHTRAILEELGLGEPGPAGGGQR